MRATRILAIPIVLLPLISCDSPTSAVPLEPQTATGIWSGQTQVTLGASPGMAVGTRTNSLRLSLTEDSTGAVTGSATLTFGGAPTVYIVTGQNHFPQLVLTLDPGSFFGPLIELRADFTSGQSLRARLLGAGFDGEQVLLQRTAPSLL